MITYTLARRLIGGDAEPGDGTCAVCGRMAAKTISVYRAVSDAFTDFAALLKAPGETACTACATLLKRSELRTKSNCITEGDFAELKNAEFWDFLISPPPMPCVLTRAESRKKHCWLYAGISNGEGLQIGCDNRTILFDYALHGEARDTVLSLFQGGVGKPAIKTGNYPPRYSILYGPARLEAAEKVLSPHRASGLIAFLVDSIPAGEKNTILQQEYTMPIAEGDALAGRFLAAVAKDSELRRKDGLAFWGATFQHRVNRVASLPLSDMCDRLMGLVVVPSHHAAAGAVELIGELSAEQCALIEAAIRERPRLAVTLACQELKDARQGKEYRLATEAKGKAIIPSLELEGLDD